MSSRRIYNSFASAGNSNWGRFSGFYQYRKQLGLAGLGLGVFYAMNLEPAPYSGRLRFMIVPRWYELRVGEQGYRETMRQFGSSLLPDWHPETKRVKSVMKRIVAASGLQDDKDLEWKIHVIGGNFPPNAFVLPGGKVFVFQSILPICKDEDGLATVLSHETAHQVCRHTAEALSKVPIRMMLATALYALTGYSRLDDLVMKVTLELPGSRQMESEADYVGVLMMARACFNPDSSIGLWKRMMAMENKQGQSIPEFMSTHPASAHRIQSIEGYLPKAESEWNEHCGSLQGYVDQFWKQ